MLNSFFFQAEDGIRDTSVTGVQTCALPICLISTSRLRRSQLKTCERLHIRAPSIFTRSLIRRSIMLKQIGRASCRERGEVAVGGVVVVEIGGEGGGHVGVGWGRVCWLGGRV